MIMGWLVGQWIGWSVGQSVDQSVGHLFGWSCLKENWFFFKGKKSFCENCLLFCFLFFFKENN